MDTQPTFLCKTPIVTGSYGLDKIKRPECAPVFYDSSSLLIPQSIHGVHGCRTENFGGDGES
jgi:hypothetical protein